jgi:hypothetical protein
MFSVTFSDVNCSSKLSQKDGKSIPEKIIFLDQIFLEPPETQKIPKFSNLVSRNLR